MWFTEPLKNYLVSFSESRLLTNEELEQLSLRFDDPIVTQIDWLPFRRQWKQGYSNFLKETTDWKLLFESTMLSKFFPFLLIVIWFLIILFSLLLKNGTFIIKDIIINTFGTIIVWIVFVGVWWIITYYNSISLIFDKLSGYFYIWKIKDNFNEPPKKFLEIKKIYSIQIIPKAERTNNRITLCYELNIILKDKSRVGIVDFFNLWKIREYWNKLSIYLWVPLWDASEILDTKGTSFMRR